MYISANKTTIKLHKIVLTSFENLYRRDRTIDSPTGCVVGFSSLSFFFFFFFFFVVVVFLFFCFLFVCCCFFFFFFWGGGGGGARRYQIVSVICYVHL